MTDPSPKTEEGHKVVDTEMKEASTSVDGGEAAPSIPGTGKVKEEDVAASIGNVKVKEEDVAASTGNVKVKGEDVAASTEDATPDTATAAVPVEAPVDSSEWDHSNRRVMIYNVLKYIKNKDIPKAVKKWLESHEDPSSIVIKKWKKDPKASWVVLTCETEDMAEKLIQHINEKKVTNKKGKELIASKERKSEKRKRDGDDTDERGDNKRPPQGPMTDDQVRDKLTPLWRSSYEDQLKLKIKTMIKKCVMRVCSELKKKFQMLQKEARRNPNREKVNVYAWLESKRSIEVEEVIASPTQHAYRNKCEFTFGYRLEKEGEADEKKIPSSGFMAAGWSGGVSRPHLCPNVPWEACAIAEIMEEFLRTSPMPPYEARNHTGMWRVLTIRSSQRTKECMIILQHAPTTGAIASGNKADYSDVFESEKERLVKMFVDRDLPMIKRPTEVNETHFPLRVTSIFFQEYEGLSTPPPEHPVQHVYGKTSLTEKLGDCHFQISPGAFFQVNTQCAELLYQVVVDKIKEVSPSSSILLDICCGTGSIGLTCMKQGAVSEVVGVDISQPAITDADANAKLNGLEDKVRFIASKAEAVMGQETNRLSYSGQTKSLVAVVDPAREGLHPDVVRSIRMTEKIQRLVYVSCNPTGSLIQDAVILCAPPTKRFKGRAFRPTFAQPVDMFPLSDHCEMVMVFDRLTEEDEKGVKEEEVTKEATETTEDKKDATTAVAATEDKSVGADKSADAETQGKEQTPIADATEAKSASIEKPADAELQTTSTH